MSYAEKDMLPLGEPGEPQKAEREKRRFRDPNLEALVHPDYSGAIRGALQEVKAGGLDIDSAHSIIMQMFAEIAATDRKTGLYLREAVEIKLGALMDYCEETGIPLSLVYLDGYQFTRINEQLGHDKGDLTIKIIAQALQETTRNNDLSSRLYEEVKQKNGNGNNGNGHNARVGGDEFLMVLPEANDQQALGVLSRFADRLTTLSNQCLPEHQTLFGSPITVSAGIVQYDPQIDHNPSDLIRRAENVMKDYKAQMRQETGDSPKI